MHTRIRTLAQPRERSRALPALAACACVGIWLSTWLAPGAWMWLLLPLSALLGFSLRKAGLSVKPALCAAAIAAMLLWTQPFLHLPVPALGQHSVTGRVSGYGAARSSGGVSFRLTDVRLDGVRAGDAYCSVGGSHADKIFDGAQLQFIASAYQPSAKENQFDFDFRLWLLQSGLSYGLSSVQGLTCYNAPETAPWVNAPARLRKACTDALTRVMGDDARVASALLLGERDNLHAEEEEAFQSLGVAHVMAVSGLHVGLMAGVAGWLMTRLRVRRRLRLPILSAFVLFYCALTGFSPAALRAAVMAVLAGSARALGRRAAPESLLSAAMLLVLLVQPLQLFSASFVLSFSAMLGILLLTPRLTRALHRLPRWLGEGLAVSLAAQAGVALPTSIYFNSFPLYGVLFNLAVVPLVGVLVPLYAAALALSWVPGLSAAAGLLASLGSRALLALVQAGASLPLASVRVPTATACFAAAFAGCVWAVSRCARAGWSRRAVAMALALGVAGLSAYAFRPADVRYHQLAAGQADAALIVDGSVTLAVDTGQYGSELCDRLLAENRNLDALFLSHLHLDHAGGVKKLLDSGISIGKVYLPEGATAHSDLTERMMSLLDLLRASGIPVETLAAGDELRYNSVSVKALWPERGKVRAGTAANPWSLTLLIDLDGARILTMGDVTDGYDVYSGVKCDVLKTAHHGGLDGTTDAFLDAALPRLALLTCSPTSRRMPSQDVLDRLTAHGAARLPTDEVGEVTLTVSNGLLQARTYKARLED